MNTKRRRSIFTRVLLFFYVVYAILVFALLMVFVFIWTILVLPAGPLRAGNLIYKGCIAWADTWFILIGIRHRNIYAVPHSRLKSYIFVANHLSYLDAPIIPKMIRQPVRPLGKEEMARIPVFGFIYRKVTTTVDRSSQENREKSIQHLKYVLGKGISIIIFPEGTFNETGEPLKEMYNGAFRLAIETGTPIKPVLILDSYDRMPEENVFSLNPGKSRAVFLEEIGVEGLDIDDVPVLKEKVIAVMEAGLRSYKASWIREE